MRISECSAARRSPIISSPCSRPPAALPPAWRSSRDERALRRSLVALAAANLVVVPYDDLYNSGVVLLALSARRPVALRDNTISRALQAEFGKGWVILWSGDLDACTLQGVIGEAQAPRTALDMPQSRSWGSVGQQHRALYADVVSARAKAPATTPSHRGLSST
jgi:hypothetical protein